MTRNEHIYRMKYESFNKLSYTNQMPTIHDKINIKIGERIGMNAILLFTRLGAFKYYKRSLSMNILNN